MFDQIGSLRQLGAPVQAIPPVALVAQGSGGWILTRSGQTVRIRFQYPVRDDRFGPQAIDPLGEEVLDKGESFILTDIECDTCEVKLVNEDGDECIRENKDLCAEPGIWKITDKGRGCARRMRT